MVAGPYRFVTHDRVPLYLDLGWCFAADLGHHGEYSILMRWLCGCPAAEPRP